ncbi:phosphatase PAP2 family protein [Limosilactobacillus caccae]|uniref:phosphatase PAP2 family protein n=1 Tax=Limosilactobacillus caccae TaxID=1926284 RepID=UPI000970C17D|nr:phosphatase PAP2 family protein [Limosilactobacillus caccae]
MKDRYKFLSGIGCWLLFSLLLVGVVNNSRWTSAIDTWGYQLTQPTGQTKTAILTELTFLGDPVTVMLVTVGMMLVLWRRKHPTDSVWYGMLQFIGYCLVILVKYGIARTRPTNRLIAVGGYSFPSGHTFSTVIFTVTVLSILYYLYKQKWQRVCCTIIGISWIILIMYSRVYLRAHFSTDVLGGLLLAGGWWLVTAPLRNYFFHWLRKPISNRPN